MYLRATAADKQRVRVARHVIDDKLECVSILRGTCNSAVRFDTYFVIDAVRVPTQLEYC